jgi:hypothetical protein
MTQQFTMRTRDQVKGFFRGLTMVDPGVVLTREWRQDAPDGEARQTRQRVKRAPGDGRDKVGEQMFAGTDRMVRWQR